MNKDLYNHQILVGKKIEKYMKENNITKSELCKMVGISRPTLNKMLSGQITNKKTFETHLYKIFSTMNINSEELLQDKSLLLSDRISQFLRGPLNVRRLSEIACISETKLISWMDGGEYPTNEELSLLAYNLGTSAKHLTGDFCIALDSTLNHCLFPSSKNFYGDSFSGYWGHVAIQLPGIDRMRVYPITYSTYSGCFSNLQTSKYVCFTTLNNRFVMINQDNVDRILFLDDACDDYPDAEITEDDYIWPQEIYTCLDNFLAGETNNIPHQILEEIESNIRNMHWDEKSIDILDNVFIDMKSGRHISFVPNTYEEIAFAFEVEYYDQLEDNSSIIIESEDGVITFIKKNNISLLDAPLQKIEDAMIESLDE